MEEDLRFLTRWVSGWVQKMHRDIPDEERGRIADEMCCDWMNSGLGASYQEFNVAPDDRSPPTT
jgi:hypothetical protein